MYYDVFNKVLCMTKLTVQTRPTAMGRSKFSLQIIEPEKIIHSGELNKQFIEIRDL